LEQLLRAWCSERGFGFVGGFRAFTAEECGRVPDAAETKRDAKARQD
jgi:hypothetical protein